MELPNSDKCQVPEAKITGYLLSLAHEDSRAKATFFLQFGFTPSNWATLATALKEHASQHAVVKVEDSPFGKRYVIEGHIQTPERRAPSIRSVWFIESGTDIPRLVTAYPLRRK